MKNLLGSLAVLVALLTATPVLASDVTGDRYSPYHARQIEPRAPASAESSRDAQPAAKAPCACHCMKSAAHAEGAQRAPQAH